MNVNIVTRLILLAEVLAALLSSTAALDSWSVAILKIKLMRLLVCAAASLQRLIKSSTTWSRLT
jgi:hypothetical protein